MQARNSFRTTLIASAIALALPQFAAAQDPAKDLDNVVVTATRTAITVDDALAAVEVIDRGDIERSAARSLPELLRGRAGITLVNQGGPGKLSSLFLRGTESDHGLVLVDGIRVGSATAGMAALQDIPLAQIERVEIVRGPRSSLYGADAIGGVIQVFTRRGAGTEGVRGRGRIAVGSNDLREASAGVDLRSTRGGIGIDVAHQQTDGINACLGDTFAGCFIVPGTHLDRDGYENESATLRADFAPNDAWQFEARAMRAEGHNDYDGDYADSSDIVQQVVGGSVRWNPTDAVQLKLTAGRNTDDSNNDIGGVFANRYTSTRDSASLQGDFTIAEGHAITAGFDWLRDRANVEDPWAPFARERDNRAVFVQYQRSVDSQDLQLSLRRDDNEQFGGYTTGGIAWGMRFGNGWRASLSHATAFKAPTFNELYYPGYSNPKLKPESSRSTELSLARSGKGWQVQANAFETRVEELIAYDGTVFAPNNIDEARIRGIELTGDAQLGEWSLRGQVSWLRARDASGGFNDGNQLARRPNRSARIDLDREFGAWGFGLSGIAEAARWDDAGNTLRVGGYGTVDARVSWRFAPAWTVQANVVNVFDKDYQTSAWYNQPGREYMLSLRWQP